MFGSCLANVVLVTVRFKNSDRLETLVPTRNTHFYGSNRPIRDSNGLHANQDGLVI